jgi:hypothetical protein
MSACPKKIEAEEYGGKAAGEVIQWIRILLFIFR